ncbi:MAG: hypothetical protein OXB94_01085 [Nitrospira sp.]|nr:hypothetical protein [Nitrospira sp.]
MQTMDVYWWCRAMRWLIPAFLSAMLLGGCTVPEHMQVRAGIDPRNQDDQVRFRSTYYFRVFDVCRNPDNGKVEVDGPPQRDSLYRFRMTGKASSLLSQVHFESGTLHKSEIDPFGSNVVFDKNLGRHWVVSREEIDIAARRNERYDQIERRLKLLQEIYKLIGHPDVKALKQLTTILGNSNQMSEKERQQLLEKLTAFVDELRTKAGDNLKKRFIPIIEALINSIKKQIVNLDALIISSPTKSKDDGHKNHSVCPEGTELERGFQVMGPEGISTFKQDQRLVMAMTSSGKPLIGALKELSGRMLAEYGSGSEFLLPLAKENLAILRAKRVVDTFQDEQEVKNVKGEQLKQRVIEAFDQDASQEVR